MNTNDDDWNQILDFWTETVFIGKVHDVAATAPTLFGF